MNKKLLSKTGDYIVEKTWNILSVVGLVKAHCNPKRLRLFVLASHKDLFVDKLNILLGTTEWDDTIEISYVDGKRQDYICYPD